MKVIVTGGAGFIGSNYVKQRLEKNEKSLSELVVIDNLTYAGTLENLESVKSNPKLTFVKGDGWWRLVEVGGGWRVEGGRWRVEGGGWRVEKIKITLNPNELKRYQ